jgi:hypothetical protein
VLVARALARRFALAQGSGALSMDSTAAKDDLRRLTGDRILALLDEHSPLAGDRSVAYLASGRGRLIWVVAFVSHRPAILDDAADSNDKYTQHNKSKP